MKLYRSFLPLLLVPVLLFFLGGCVSQDTQYIRRDINTLQKQIDALREDIKSAQLTTPAQPTTSLEVRKEQADRGAELEIVKRDLDSLRAIVEDNQQLAARTSTRLDDQERQFSTKLGELEIKVDQMLAKIEAAPSERGSPREEVKTPPPPVVEEPAPTEAPPVSVESDVERVYQEAYETFQAGDLEGARSQFQAFLKEYPDTPLSDNAQFWIGEIAFKKHQYEAAILAYENVIKKHPDSNKLPDAILKQGLAFLELGDKIDARIILESLIKKYPKTEQARIAKRTLQSL